MLHFTPVDPEYPKAFLELAQPPADLYIEGGELKDLLRKPRLAVVGSRKVSAYGRAVTEQLVQAISRKGVVIVSGLALGVDSIAHRACLDAGGQTIAVLPSGLSYIYPRSHEGLARHIVKQGGALVSEQPPHARPMKHHFIARNRLIAALADAILITEAAEDSGSLHTASFALELGREVMAVPGPITSSQSVGTNNLIKSGARVVVSAQDISDALGLQASPKTPKAMGSNPAEYVVLQLLADGLHDADELLARSNLEPQLFQQTLSMLEITGRARPAGNNHWILN